MIRKGERNLIMDVAGLAVGNAEDAIVRTGVTALLTDGPAAAAVDVRGGAPGTRDSEALDPVSLVDGVDAIVLAGGSAFGLDAASGVQSHLKTTDADLTRIELKRLAIMAADGFARALRPVHTPFDGDLVYAISTARCPLSGSRPAAVMALGMTAADCLARAIARGVYEAASLGVFRSYRDTFP